MPQAAPDIAVVIPHYQRQLGLLGRALRSVFAQTIADRVCVVICDDSSPSPAEPEVRAMAELPQNRIHIVAQPNRGPGAARNSALESAPAVPYVAFLDSDDAWRPNHLENALAALARGYDAYFADFIAVGHPGIGNMERIGSLKPGEHRLLDAARRLHELAVSPLEHTVADAGGLIQTSTVVYRFDKFFTLRFREEFFNGQDLFFWIDLGQRGARFAFSFDVECENGEGVNIFQGSGWGTERSLERLRNEFQIWTSIERLYALKGPLQAANHLQIRRLQEALGRELLHRLRRGKPISLRLLKDIVRMRPSTLWFALWAPLGIARQKLS
jgi:succinoglycan biosynthesis protein ExoW